MQWWINDALHCHAEVRHRGGHDEGSFIASWFTHYLVFGEERYSTCGIAVPKIIRACRKRLPHLCAHR